MAECQWGGIDRGVGRNRWWNIYPTLLSIPLPHLSYNGGTGYIECMYQKSCIMCHLGHMYQKSTESARQTRKDRDRSVGRSSDRGGWLIDKDEIEYL